MDNNPDSKLNYEQKLELIKWIPIRQQERWERMKRFHGHSHITMEVRHFFMKQEIKLMRSQEKRYKKLLNEVFNEKKL